MDTQPEELERILHVDFLNAFLKAQRAQMMAGTHANVSCVQTNANACKQVGRAFRCAA